MEMRLSPMIVNDPFYYIYLFAGNNYALFFTAAAIPCAVSWPDDRNYGMTSYMATRCSPKQYARAKTVGAWASYFLFSFAVVLLLMLCVILVTGIWGVPSERPYIECVYDLTRTYYAIASKSYFLYYVTRATTIALIAGMWSMISFLVSVCFANVFLTIAVPPIVVYFMINLMRELSAPLSESHRRCLQQFPSVLCGGHAPLHAFLRARHLRHSRLALLSKDGEGGAPCVRHTAFYA